MSRLRIHRRKRHTVMSEMNVVPYIDVMLVLLVIFMITTPLLTQGVKVNLPKTTTHSLSVDQDRPIIVTVDKAGRLYLNTALKPKVPMPMVTLKAQLHQALKVRGSDKKVYLRGDSEVDFGKVVRAMSALQQAGVNSIGIITQLPENKISGRA